ncbi:Gfo/Idh/MocA family protein [Paenibacillus oceani]|uniref:Gfo/Idh/MocA family oxidoreductase n=1 Tax=Paenibacillus oceani TaxID=2772510 RepID=A0A927CCR7_9BACL|nr:Gfo/Idh/MocA family oxidoreductase [Paenibacillus oceani]MBD2864402.1 Gfo/Idh/MocA family oxidoreductase [Paenibacillus oceani]
MNKVRVGFIGVGGMAEGHIQTLQSIEQAELTCVYDVNAERANQVGARYGAKVYDSADALLDSGLLDALFLCTPPFARGDLEERAAARGIHLFAEKPVDLSVEAARRKSKAIRESGIIHSSGYCLRYMDTVQKAKSYLAGKPVHMVMAYRIGSLPAATWWHRIDKPGGQLVEQGTHQVDLIRYIVGEFREMNAMGTQRLIRTIRPDATIPDVGVVSFDMESGAIGSIATSCISNRMGRGDVEVFGTDFYLSINGYSLKIVDENGAVEEKSQMNVVLEQDRAFVEAIRTGRQSLVLCGYDDAIETLRVTVAANESMESGRTVVV